MNGHNNYNNNLYSTISIIVCGASWYIYCIIIVTPLWMILHYNEQCKTYTYIYYILHFILTVYICGTKSVTVTMVNTECVEVTSMYK